MGVACLGLPVTTTWPSAAPAFVLLDNNKKSDLQPFHGGRGEFSTTVLSIGGDGTLWKEDPRGHLWGLNQPIFPGVKVLYTSHFCSPVVKG
jgi:hypothetical protein